MLYAIALAGGRVVTLLRPKRHSVHPSDLHLLLNTIAASPSLSAAGSETWLPICLPRYNSSGFLHAFVGSLAPSITLVFVSADREAFFGLRDWKAELVPKLPLAALERALDRQSYRCGELAVAGLRHFVYKARPLVQVTAPTWDAEYEAEADRQRIVTLYQRAIDLLHPRSNTGRQPAKLVLLRSEHEAVLGWVRLCYWEVLIATGDRGVRALRRRLAHAADHRRRRRRPRHRPLGQGARLGALSRGCTDVLSAGAGHLRLASLPPR